MGIALAVAAVTIRTALSPALGELAPYALNFVALTLAAVIAGWRSGLVTLVLGQWLAWYAIVPLTSAVQQSRLATFIVATLTELMILAIIGLYQREVDRGTRERERRLHLQEQVLKEIDHRTRNNYQTVLAMVELQARRSDHDGVRDALRQVAERIEAISNASSQLAARSSDLGAVRLDDHLCGLIQQIERGLSRAEIEVECDVDEVTASADTATSISIIVNELVTNAIKHAFNGERSGHVWVTGKSGSRFELVVADNGCGMQGRKTGDRTGLGTRLVESFARQLGAEHDVSSSDEGTTHRLFFPRLD